MRIISLAIVSSFLIGVVTMAAEPEPVKQAQDSAATRSDLQSTTESKVTTENATEFEDEVLWREYPDDQRGSEARDFWGTSEKLLAEPERIAVPANGRSRAVTEGDLEELATSTPGTEVSRAETPKTVTGAAKPEAKKPVLNRCADAEESKRPESCFDRK